LTRDEQEVNPNNANPANASSFCVKHTFELGKRVEWISKLQFTVRQFVTLATNYRQHTLLKHPRQVLVSLRIQHRIVICHANASETAE
jgi:hypothetical protein